MKNLYKIIARKPGAPYVIAEKIKGFNLITGDAKKHFLNNNPVIYEDEKGRNFSSGLDEIITAEDGCAVKSLGLYKIPVDCIAPAPAIN